METYRQAGLGTEKTEGDLTSSPSIFSSLRFIGVGRESNESSKHHHRDGTHVGAQGMGRQKIEALSKQNWYHHSTSANN